MNPKMLALVLVLAVSVALSGCVGQSGGANQTTPNTPSGTPSGANADWCIAGVTSSYPAGAAGTVTMTTTGLETYAFPDGSLSVCCFDGQATVEDVPKDVKVCVDREGKHSVQWWANVGQPLAKLLETYPSGDEVCIKMYDQTGEVVTDTCQ